MPDPMAGKYPWLSPYNYCANNPLIFIDPDGMRVQFSDEDKDYAQTLLDQLNEKHEGAGLYLKQEDDLWIVAISEESSFDFGQDMVTSALYDLVESSDNIFTVDFIFSHESAIGQSNPKMNDLSDVGGGFCHPYKRNFFTGRTKDAIVSIAKDPEEGETYMSHFGHEAIGHGHPVGNELRYNRRRSEVAGAINIQKYYGSNRIFKYHDGYNRQIRWKKTGLWKLKNKN